MVEKDKVAKRKVSPDWFMRGALTRIGDTLDAFTGRRWVPSSTLATSELIERMKRLLDSEVKEVTGKGRVVPHNIKLKMQWDKFSTDSEEALESLQNELLAAAADHINDSLYYTFAPLHVEVKPDYFTEGVKLYVGFDKFSADEPDVEMNVTMLGVQLSPETVPSENSPTNVHPAYVFRYTISGVDHEKQFEFGIGKRVSVGRTANNDLSIDDVSVSKIHASFMADAHGAISVADTGSTNGTFINQERISYGKASVLEAGDRVKFGTVEVTFERLAGPERSEEVPVSVPMNIDEMEFKSGPAPPTSTGDETVKIDEGDINNSPTVANFLDPAAHKSETQT